MNLTLGVRFRVSDNEGGCGDMVMVCVCVYMCVFVDVYVCVCRSRAERPENFEQHRAPVRRVLIFIYENRAPARSKNFHDAYIHSCAYA